MFNRFFCCSYNNLSGESFLLKFYLKYYYKFYSNRIFIHTPGYSFLYKSRFNKRNKIPKFSNIFFRNYISPFIGIFILIKKRKVYINSVYFNYFPLWNFIIIFLHVFFKVNVGILTGSLPSNKCSIRYLIIYFLNSISIFILKYSNFRYLCNSFHLYNYLLKSSISDKVLPQFSYFDTSRIVRLDNLDRDIDFIFYDNRHPVKDTDNLYFFLIENFSSYHIKSFGPSSDFSTSVGLISNDDVYTLLCRSKVYISFSSELLGLTSYEAFQAGCLLVGKIESGMSFFKNQPGVLLFDNFLDLQVLKEFLMATHDISLRSDFIVKEIHRNESLLLASRDLYGFK